MTAHGGRPRPRRRRELCVGRRARSPRARCSTPTPSRPRWTRPAPASPCSSRRSPPNTLEYMRKERELLLDGVGVPDITHRVRRPARAHRRARLRLPGGPRSAAALHPGVPAGARSGSTAAPTRCSRPASSPTSSSATSTRSPTTRCAAAPSSSCTPTPTAAPRASSGSRRSGSTPVVFPAAGTSEDVAMLLADDKGAELIVAVGTHATLVEFLDKGRAGMAATFLTRLRVGGKLVDAKGVSRLYRSRISSRCLVLMLLVGLLALGAALASTPAGAGLLQVLGARWDDLWTVLVGTLHVIDFRYHLVSHHLGLPRPRGRHRPRRRAAQGPTSATQLSDQVAALRTRSKADLNDKLATSEKLVDASRRRTRRPCQQRVMSPAGSPVTARSLVVLPSPTARWPSDRRGCRDPERPPATHGHASTAQPRLVRPQPGRRPQRRPPREAAVGASGSGRPPPATRCSPGAHRPLGLDERAGRLGPAHRRAQGARRRRPRSTARWPTLAPADLAVVVSGGLRRHRGRRRRPAPTPIRALVDLARRLDSASTVVAGGETVAAAGQPGRPTPCRPSARSPRRPGSSPPSTTPGAGDGPATSCSPSRSALDERVGHYGVAAGADRHRPAGAPVTSEPPAADSSPPRRWLPLLGSAAASWARAALGRRRRPPPRALGAHQPRRRPGHPARGAGLGRRRRGRRCCRAAAVASPRASTGPAAGRGRRRRRRRRPAPSGRSTTSPEARGQGAQGPPRGAGPGRGHDGRRQDRRARRHRAARRGALLDREPPHAVRGLLATLVGGAVVAGAANAVNLFDLRPGRALKVTVAAGLPLVAAACPRPPPSGAVARCRCATTCAAPRCSATPAPTRPARSLGLALVERTGLVGPGRSPSSGLAALTLASERVSFTRVIEATPGAATARRVGP